VEILRQTIAFVDYQPKTTPTILLPVLPGKTPVARRALYFLKTKTEKV
jgi:hypothetical protein